MSRVRTLIALVIVSALAFAGVGGSVWAQQNVKQPVKRDAPSVDSSSFQVTGVSVDVSGTSAEAARQGGWRLAQRKGWEMLSRRMTGHSSTLSDSALDSIVSGIIVEQEQAGPTRYIAKLGVLFDRGKAASILGVSGQVTRSTSMLIVPLIWSGGVGTTYERNTPWHEAWKRFQPGNSSIDYIRLGGTGPDALLLNAGQVGRRSRGWWRAVLGQYEASDVLIAEVQLRRQYPGGPVVGIFTASHGPDKVRIAQFSLRVDNVDGLDSLLDAGVKRIDQAFQDALRAGRLKSDPSLAYRPPPEVAEEAAPEEEATSTPTPTPGTVETTASFTVQVETPSAASVTASESAMRAIPGVRSANTTSLALGGVSVMRVSYDGPIGSLRAALEARGWQVQEGPGVLRIRRPGGGGAAPASTGGANGG